jgi:hypothetical protein
MGLHNEGESHSLDTLYRGATTPTAYYLRLCNSLKLRLTSVTGTFQIGETVSGGSSVDSGVIYGIKNNPDGSVTLKLGDLTETTVFSVGETITGGTSAATGTVDNATITMLNVSGVFQANETVSNGSTGTGQIVTVGPDLIVIQEYTGDWAVGDTVTGDESAATGTINHIYAGEAGLFDNDTLLMPAPVQSTPTTSATGTLNGTYYYTVTALDAAGRETAQSNEVSETVDGGTTAGTINLSWSAIRDAKGYRVWRGTTAGGENEYYDVSTTSLADNGSLTFTAGTPPSSGTASYLPNEPSGNGYSPILLNANTTDFPTLTQDSAGDYYVESVQKTFTASGGDIGPVNTLVLATSSDNTGELWASSAMKECPPSKVIHDGESMNVQQRITQM